MAGVEAVFHLAAIYEFGVPPERMEQVNIGGTRNILDAAARAGVARIVYCGSDTSLGPTSGQVGDESQVHPGTDYRSAYESTKHRAHLLVSERMRAGAPIVNCIVSTVYGPGDKSAIGELMEFHLAGKLAFTIDRNAGYTFAHVDDVATALRLAYDKGRPGESYLVSGEPQRFGELFDKMSALTGIPAPGELPRWFAAFLPALIVLGPLIGKSSAAIRELLAMGRNVTRFFSGEKARRELGWQPRPLSRGLAETMAWYQRREQELAARGLYGFTRLLLVCLLLFDIGLGGQAAFLPNAYLASMHPHFWELHPSGPTYLLLRTGVLWLVFAFVEGVAAWNPRRNVLWVLAVAVLRLMDVPADLFYRFTADDLGAFGRFALIFAPVFNFLSGTYLLLRARRAIRAGLASTRNVLAS
jgi:dihydroflavonol-4-reductase